MSQVTAKADRKEKQPRQAKQTIAAMKKTAEKMTYDNPTPPGEKPDLSEFPSEYSPPRTECAWYSWWEKQGFFHNSGKGDEKFVMVLPPPNVTGELHLGHALTCAIEDSLVRYHRMMGKDTMWIPGTDHAGIATQVRVEKMLHLEKGLTRHDITREQFLEHAHEWTRKYGGNIINQLKVMGSSLDWERLFFTMDPTRSEAVTEAFIRLFNKGKIYRSERLVNWDCALQTAISDAEVEFQTIEKRTLLPVPNHKYEKYPFGVFTYFRYPIADENGQPTSETVLIATTRLETMLGDEAVAINSKDERYKHLHGKRVYHPFRKCTLPIICDDILVDIEFGTGVVKVTPAHDPNDFETGLRHNLKFTNILTVDGKINDICPEFAGLPRFDARIEIAKKLKEMKLWEKEEDHAMRLGITQRGHDVVEQIMKKQWWVDTKSMAERAIEVVESGKMKIVPDVFVTDWNKWHENIRPWCISRQLWWGHRIPAYKVWLDGVEQTDDKEWVVGRDMDDAMDSACKKFGVTKEHIKLVQDEDVLDTWFSSALLPFSSLKWPTDNEELKKYYPGTMLETGWDILTFWVSRMVMMSLELNDCIPFETVLLHPLVRDPQGRKMSKSLGNVVNPLHVKDSITLEELIANLREAHLDEKELATATEGMKAGFPHGIPQCGCDAMRMALCAFAGAGRTAPMNVNVIVSYRNFCNKMWNAVKFAMQYLKSNAPFDPAKLTHADKWVLRKLSLAFTAAKNGFVGYKMGDAVPALMRFFHEEFCSVYLEAIKPTMAGDDEDRKNQICAIIYEVIESSLRMIHPFMPFVTEDLWQRIPRRFDVPSIMLAPYPQPVPEWEAFDTHVMENAMLCASAARAIKTTYKIKAQTMDGEIVTDIPDIAEAFELVSSLARIGKVTAIPAGSPPQAGYAAKVVSDTMQFRLNLKGQGIDFQTELKKTNDQKAKIVVVFQKLEAKVNAPDYATKVPEKVQAAEKEKLEAYRAQIAAMDEVIAFLNEAVSAAD